jgi:serine/threonine protein kinase
VDIVLPLHKKGLKKRLKSVFSGFKSPLVKLWDSHKACRSEKASNNHPAIETKIKLEDLYEPLYKELGNGSGGSVALYRVKRRPTAITPRSSLDDDATMAPSRSSLSEKRSLEDGNDLVAVKKFRQRRFEESKTRYLTKLEQEAHFATTLIHDNIGTAYHVFVDQVISETRGVEPRLRIVMPVYPADLFSFLTNPKAQLSQMERIAYARNLVHAIHYMHMQGVAHRDIKLENICIDAENTLKVIDFGSAGYFLDKNTGLKVRSFGIHGSDPYIAPEIFEAEARGFSYDADLGDLWSIGIVWLCLIRKAFLWDKAEKSDSGFAGFRRRRERMWAGLKSSVCVTEEEKEIVMGLLHPDPEARMNVDLLKLKTDLLYAGLFKESMVDKVDVISIQSMVEVR